MKPALIALAFAFPAATALAQPPGPPPDGHPPGPPAEAIEACEGMEEGDLCAMEFPDGTVVEGTCMAPPPDVEDGELACAPEGHRPPPPPTE